MGILWCDSVLVIQLQGTDKGSLQLFQKVKGTAEKCNMTANRLAAGKTGNGLVYNCLENGSGKILLGGTIVDQRLDVSLGKYTAAGCDGIKRLVILRMFIQPGGICLKQGRAYRYRYGWMSCLPHTDVGLYSAEWTTH